MALEDLPAGMVQEQAEVLQNRRVAPDHYRMRLASRPIARGARPGQFVHVRCPSEPGRWDRRKPRLPRYAGFPWMKTSRKRRDIPGQESETGRKPLLRRPFSLFDANPSRGTVEIIYKVVGTGTVALARVKAGEAGFVAGERVDVLGPLGSPFQIPEGIRQAWLVGGGVGIPPLYFLAKRLKGVEVRVFLGARTRGWVLCASDFRRLGVEAHVATDDGSLGHRGSVVDLLKRFLPSTIHHPPPTMLYLCGPTPMMAVASALARRLGISAQVSLEERMGCAMGVCMGCCVEVTTEPKNSHARFQRVCTEGPVFPAEAIQWQLL